MDIIEKEEEDLKDYTEEVFRRALGEIKGGKYKLEFVFDKTYGHYYIHLYLGRLDDSWSYRSCEGFTTKYFANRRFENLVKKHRFKEIPVLVHSINAGGAT
jgi:hypothetical protein